MIRPDYYIFGYRIFTIEKEDVKPAVKLFLKNGVNVKIKGCKFMVKESEAAKISKLLSTRVKFTSTEMLGFPGFLYKNRKRFGVFCALLFTLTSFFVLSDKVWDIRIEGSEAGYEEEILKELSKCGMSVGKRFSKLDVSKIEVELLKNSQYVSWVNVYRRGSVAYVTVVDKIVFEEKEEKEGYSNVVASRDAVIEEITVVRGVAAVKAGESVKKGQLLISGVLPSESGGGFCYAEGSVIGRVSETVESTVGYEIVEKVEKKPEIYRVSVKIFDFSVNIFKSYGKVGEEYDIIEKTENISVLNTKLPISVTKTYRAPYTEKTVSLDEGRMAEMALFDMESKLNDRLSFATLMRIRSEGEFTADGYVLKSYLVIAESIGQDLPFKVEE